MIRPILILLLISLSARAEKVTIDLSDDWVPFIFEDMQGADGQPLSNRYANVYVGLANDTGDNDGQPLPPGSHNYLELYGIPPSLSVLRARFLDDEKRDCSMVDLQKLAAVRWISAREPKAEARYVAKLRAVARLLEKQRRRAHLETLDELAAAQPKLAKQIAEVQRYALQKQALPEVEKRLRCEGILTDKSRHQKGVWDEPLREAVIRFQHKHMLYDAAALRPDTMQALQRSLIDNDYAALVRVMTERVVAASGVLEDGSVDGRRGPPTYTNEKGEKVPVRNMVDETVKAALAQIGLDSADKALAFFHQHGEFKDYQVPVELPAPPEYYSPNMDLSVIIDRGDVFYDPPYDAQGKPVEQNRKHFPMLTLRVKWNNQWIPLVRWRTTIGGWRSDLASNGYEYLRYKGSDVGPRVWRHIVSGPVWIAPNSTPLHTLVKAKRVNRKNELVVNYDEVGPGFLSAYGLVAAYNVVPGRNGRPDWDNGVRVHGSSEILSIRNPDAYSHGCHRLMNHLAVRLFSFVLRHRPVIVIGDRPLDFSRQWLWKEQVFEMRLPSRGFWYQLEPPVPVNVLEGNIIGDTKKPITGYIPKPGVKYPPGPLPVPMDTPEARAGGDE